MQQLAGSLSLGLSIALNICVDQMMSLIFHPISSVITNLSDWIISHQQPNNDISLPPTNGILLSSYVYHPYNVAVTLMYTSIPDCIVVQWNGFLSCWN